MTNICREGLTTNGTWTLSSGPWWIGMPRFSRIRHDKPCSQASSGNASVRNGPADSSFEARSNKHRQGPTSSMTRPVTIVFSFRNTKVRLPDWENTCKVDKHRGARTRGMALTRTKSPVVQSHTTKLSTDSSSKVEVKRQPSLFSHMTASSSQPLWVGQSGISNSRRGSLARGWGPPSESLSRWVLTLCR